MLAAGAGATTVDVAGNSRGVVVAVGARGALEGARWEGALITGARTGVAVRTAGEQSRAGATGSTTPLVAAAAGARSVDIPTCGTVVAAVRSISTDAVAIRVALVPRGATTTRSLVVLVGTSLTFVPTPLVPASAGAAGIGVTGD